MNSVLNLSTKGLVRYVSGVLPRYERVIIVGPSGVGKSHLVDALSKSGLPVYDTDESGKTIGDKFLVRYEEIDPKYKVLVGVSSNLEEINPSARDFLIFICTNLKNYSLIARAKFRDMPDDKPVAWFMVHLSNFYPDFMSYKMLIDDYHAKYALSIGKSFDAKVINNDTMKGVPQEGWLNKSKDKRGIDIRMTRKLSKTFNSSLIVQDWSDKSNGPAVTKFHCKLKSRDSIQKEIFSLKLVPAMYNLFEWQKGIKDEVESVNLSAVLNGFFQCIVHGEIFALSSQPGDPTSSLRLYCVERGESSLKKMVVVKFLSHDKKVSLDSRYSICFKEVSSVKPVIDDWKSTRTPVSDPDSWLKLKRFWKEVVWSYLQAVV